MNRGGSRTRIWLNEGAGQKLIIKIMILARKLLAKPHMVVTDSLVAFNRRLVCFAI
jgi:hypothetical protein